MPARKRQTRSSPLIGIVLLIGFGAVVTVGYFTLVGRDIKTVKVGPGVIEVKTKKHHQHQEAPATAQAGLVP